MRPGRLREVLIDAYGIGSLSARVSKEVAVAIFAGLPLDVPWPGTGARSGDGTSFPSHRKEMVEPDIDAVECATSWFWMQCAKCRASSSCQAPS